MSTTSVLDDFCLSKEKSTASKCLKLIQQYSWLLDAFILDFYTEDHWGRLPSTWKEVLSETSLGELGGWMSMNERHCQRVWPLSLIALRASAKAYSLSRTQAVSSKDEPKNGSEEVEAFLKSPVKEHTGKAGSATCCLTHESLKQLFVKQVKPKKRHETVIMGNLCARAALESGINCVIDVGGGKGHLSRLLAYGYGLNVFCVEAQSDLILSAREIDIQIEYTASKCLGDKYVQSLPKPQYMEMTVGCSDEALWHFKKEIYEKILKHSGDEVTFGIVGLHPCGNLAATLLRLFATLEEAKFVCIASCCYMKLSFNKCDEIVGYPLSNFFSTLPKSLSYLSYEALEVSCHALEVYCQRLQKQEYNILKIHCFRAVLEKIIVKYYPEMKHIGLRSVKHFDGMDFPTYAVKALERVSIDIPPSELSCQDTIRKLERWQDVVALYSLRLLLAPLVETAVILDRLLFIHEQGGVGSVVPGFDPVISPRNLILQGYKR